MQGDRHHDVMWVFASKWKPGNRNEEATSGSDEKLLEVISMQSRELPVTHCILQTWLYH